MQALTKCVPYQNFTTHVDTYNLTMLCCFKQTLSSVITKQYCKCRLSPNVHLTYQKFYNTCTYNLTIFCSYESFLKLYKKSQCNMRNEFKIFLHLKTTFYQEELEKTWACLVRDFCTVLGPSIFLQISVSRIVCLVSRRFHSSPPFLE